MTVMTDDDRGYPAAGYAWCVVAVLIGTAILSYTDRQVLSLLVDPVRRDLGITDTDVGYLFGPAFALVYGIAGIPLGLLADRVSRCGLIAAGIAVWSLGTIGCGYAHSFAQLFAARIIVGLGESALSPAAISLISDYFAPNRRGLAVGSYLSGIAIGSGVAILIGGATLRLVESGALGATPLAGIAPWRLVLLILGAPGLVWSAVVLTLREPARRSTPVMASNAGPRGTWGAWGAWGTLASGAPVFAIVAIASLVDNAVGAWAPTLLIRSFGIDAAQVGLRLGVLLTIGFGAGVLAGGWLADQVSRTGHPQRKILVCLVLAILILPVSRAINSSALPAVMAAIPAYFALSGAVTACGFSALLDRVPGHQRGFAMAFSFFLNVALGASLGPLLVTEASSRLYGSAAGYGPAIALVAAAGYALCATVAALNLGKPTSASTAAR